MSHCGRIGAVVTLLLLASVAASQDVDCTAGTDPAVIKQAEQKLVLLLRMIGDTGPAKRVSGSGNQEAQAALAEAREHSGRASALLDEGCGAESVEQSTAGLGRASKAFSLARNRAPQGDTAYRAVLDRTTSFLRTLESQPDEARGISAADINGMHRQIERAEELAINGNYQSAADLLKPVVDRLERRLAAIYDQQTVYYEKKFEGPADEYAYLVQQHRGYRMLMEQYAGDRQPPHSSKQAYDNFLKSAADLADSAEMHAQVSEWDLALEQMRQAVTSYERAMRLIGIGY
jgi:hypothetical protein